MNASDQRYLEKRAREERERAAASEKDVAAMVHLKLAEEYERRAANVRSPR